MRGAREPLASPAWVYSQLLKLHPPAAAAPLCVAFSGGEDSTALLSLLAEVAAIAREESWFFGPPRTRNKNFGTGPFPGLQVRAVSSDGNA